MHNPKGPFRKMTTKNTLKRAGAALAASAMMFTLAACSSSEEAPAATGGAGGGEAPATQGPAGDLVLYSSMTENDLTVLQNLLEDKFPGINLEIVNGSAGELTSRIAAESAAPVGDFMWGALDVMDGDRHSEIFEHWLSDYEDTLPEAYRSPNGFYNVDHLSTAAFAVNEGLAAELGVEIKGYADLLNPALKGKILMADPTSSSSAWNNLSNILSVFGYEGDAAWDYVGKLMDNGLVIASSSSATFAAVEEGEYVVGLTYEDGVASLIKSGAQNVKLVYPAEGTSASAFGTAIIKGAPHMELAKQVVNYIMSPEGQTALGEGLSTIRMTTSEPYHSEYLPPASEIKWVERDIAWLTANRDDVIAKWTDLYTQKMG